jgi:hypothetical protein
MDDGMYYPFINEYLAKQFQAAVIQIEHRLYGPYQPIRNASTDELLQYLTVHQALADMIAIAAHFKMEIRCGPVHSSPGYSCSKSKIVQGCIDFIALLTFAYSRLIQISVGASYPGFLSALCRFIYPDFVDIAYASSAPLLMYAQHNNPYMFYDTVTDSAERSSPGCAQTVRTVLQQVADICELAPTLNDAAEQTGICGNAIAGYIKTKNQLKDAIFMVAGFAFADFNMINYPPGPDTYMAQSCALFMNKTLTVNEVMDSFFRLMLAEDAQEFNECNKGKDNSYECETVKSKSSCFDLSSQLPDKNPSTTLEDRGGDYEDGKMWGFQTCTEIIFIGGYS